MMAGTIASTDLVSIQTQRAQLNFVVDSGGQAKLLYVGCLRDVADWVRQVKPVEDAFSLTELQVAGGDFKHKGAKHASTSESYELVYADHTVQDLENGKLVTIHEFDEQCNLDVYSYFRLYNNTATVRSWKKVKNHGTTPVTVEYLSSFNYSGLLQQDDYPGNYATHDDMYIAHNSWTTELQWQKDSIQHLGMPYFGQDYEVDVSDSDTQDSGEPHMGVYLSGSSSKRIGITNNSSWSCSEYSPNGGLHNRATNQSAFWQIENNGAWHYEVENHYDGSILNLELSGPEEYDNQFWTTLKPDDEFTTVTAAFVQVNGPLETAIDEMTVYRRNIRRNNVDNQKLPVIFNDYMNCLMGDPTSAKEFPLIDAAAKAGCEYFVVDCGWYDDGYWWDTVGEWQPSKKRFPNGIEEVTDYIASKGMVPGLWLEPEVMGIRSDFANTLPDDWFFLRNGKRIIDIDRYLLDFRNPAVVDYVTKVVDRLVNDYHVGYIKMDYNVTTGVGTDYHAENRGKALLDHNRAVLAWRDSLYQKYPDLVIENCSSGGMRHDYAMLSKDSIQSVSDQTDYTLNAAISGVAATAIAPEQSAIWSYPLPKGDREETIYNMCNALLCRIHQSGYLNKISKERLADVAEGIAIYKNEIRQHIPHAVPVWPKGFPHVYDDEIVYGIRDEQTLYLGVWNNLKANHQIQVDLSAYGEVTDLKQIYPGQSAAIRTSVANNIGLFTFPQAKMARIFKVTLK
ncbi:glycoside hydrolase family 36 protein [Levilactobacillus enshiensis]|uniref:glycoside hydrolase family 36 protein n=1 Tax=Levilactobacillus enshiensis TaxID=2590213 RepID=UPI001CDD26D8|nr:alpha-galactosidase [Levilactobacillus enshiensis]